MVILVTTAHFLGVRTEKKRKTENPEKLQKAFFGSFLKIKNIYRQLLEKIVNDIKNKICTKFAPSSSVILKTPQRLEQ